MFCLRHLLPIAPVALLTLLASCSVYDASLLDDARAPENGGALSIAGSGSVVVGQGGRPSGGSTTTDPEQTDGGAGKPGGANGNNAGSGPGVAGGGGADSGAGASGATGLGGSTNTSAGSANGGSASPPTGVDLVDDMEDGNAYLSPKPPRYGFWYVAGDQSVGANLVKIDALMDHMSPARGSSTSAVHFTATGFKDWGASVGFRFTDAVSKRSAYNASAAVGVSFWVCGSVTGDAKLSVLFPIVGTDPTGKLCGGTDQGLCGDHFRTQVAVTAAWKQVTVLFSSLHQAGWGTPLAAFDPAQLLGIEWSAAAPNVDVWIDDLALLTP